MSTRPDQHPGGDMPDWLKEALENANKPPSAIQQKFQELVSGASGK